MLYLNLPPEFPQNWGQINRNYDHYHSDPADISSPFWIPAIMEWWCQQEGTYSKYANLSNIACDKFSIILPGVRVEASFSLQQHVNSWRKTKYTGETLHEIIVVMQFAQAHNGLLSSNDPALDTKNTDNDSQMKREVEHQTLHRMAKDQDCLEMWQGSQNLCATQKESHTQHKQLTAIRYISDTEAIVKVSWSNIQYDGAAAVILSERSRVPPALSAKDLPGGPTQVLNLRQIK